MCVVYSFLAGNLLCVWAFNKKDVELKRSFANLLNCLAIFDSLFLTCLLLQYSIPTLSEHYLVRTLSQYKQLVFLQIIALLNDNPSK